MSLNLLDQLSQQPVPPPPSDLGRRVHRRLNGWLLFGQLTDFAVRGLLYAALHFFRALIAAVIFSVTGRHEEKR